MFTFRGEVAVGGYEWVKGDSPQGAFLEPRGEKVQKYWRQPGSRGFILDGRWHEVKTRSIAPLEEHTGLFRMFADIEPTYAGIKAFADEYGPLWHAESSPAMLHPATVGIPRYHHWVINILLMRVAITLWELWRCKDTQGLAAYVHWHEPSIVRIDTHPDCVPNPLAISLFRDFPVHSLGALLHAVGSESHLHSEDQDVPAKLHVLKYFDSTETQRFPPGDLCMPALAYIRALVETVLTTSCSLHMIEAPTVGSLGLRFTPAALLDALWLQFACAIDGNKDYRQCQECKRWFELSPGIARSDRLFCSNACRTRAYRQRIAHTRRRYKAGMSIEDIARELETDCDTVQGWVTSSRKPPQHRATASQE